MASQDKRPGDGFDLSLLEGLRERVGQDMAAEEDFLPARSAKKSLLFGALIGLAAAAGAAWYILGTGGAGNSTAPQEVPVVKSEKAPVKVRPADPGGLEVPNQDKLVYNRVDQGSVKPEVEHLLPQPVQPKDLPKAQPADKLGDGMAPLPAAPALPEAVKPVETAKVTPPPAAKPEPKAETEKPAAKAEAAKPAAAPAKAGSGAWQVQLAALREEARAETEWTRAVKKAPELGKLPHQVIRADLGSKGVFYRLRAGDFAAREQADALCDGLKAKGVGCVVAKR
ncbi:SPOR domain-containing protein [Oleispirillum naphthae]|uniref:SPOR domain-containing protein n=1 Tax=Oleispirillum naphthae TaxID=2838853 RepID=UPI0030823685